MQTHTKVPCEPPSAEGGDAHRFSKLLRTSGSRSVEGVRNAKRGWIELSFMGRYPLSCMALVRHSETLKNLAWYLVSTLYKIGRVQTRARRGAEALTWVPIIYCSTDVRRAPVRS